MTKDVLVTVTGVQTVGNAPIELVTPGTYYRKNGTHYLFYNESADGSESTTRNRVMFDDGQVDVKKNGYINVSFLFIEGKRTVSNYSTPFGSLPTAVTTTHLAVDESEREIQIVIRYALSIGGQDMEDCEVGIRIRPRDVKTKEPDF